VETATLNETELSEYCRRKGIYPVQVANWKACMMQGGKPQSLGQNRLIVDD